MRLSTGVLLMLGAVSGSPLQELCVLPATRHLNFSHSCADQPAPARGVSWAAQRGEFESAQILVRPSSSGLGRKLALQFGDLVAPSGAVIPSRLLRWRQQGFVFTRHTSRYADSGCPGANQDGSCWRPDPLLDPMPDGSITLPTQPGWSQPIWLTVQVPRGAAPAPEGQEYRGVLNVSVDGAVAASLPVVLEVWPVTVPTTAEASVQHDWHFSSALLAPYYPDLPMDRLALQWWTFMEEHRLPPIDSAAWAPGSSGSFLSGKTGMLEAGIHLEGCNCSSCTDSAAQSAAAGMAATVRAARNVSGASLFGYGFDERPRSCEKSIRKAFGAFLEQYPVAEYPELGGTMAALNWAGSKGNNGSTGSHPSDGGMPLDMPLTGWVLQYQYYNHTTADAWVNSTVMGRDRKMYLYHCIEPSGADYLNIFIERPLIQARLLFWLAATQNVQGWLYWATNLWKNCPESPHEWQRRPRSVMRRINGSFLTDFDPASIIWCSDKLYDFWVNGDGYPAPSGLVLTGGRLLHVSGARWADLKLEARADPGRA